jgi:hypothetical protein
MNVVTRESQAETSSPNELVHKQKEYILIENTNGFD